MTTSRANDFKNISYARELLSSSTFVNGSCLLVAADMVTSGGLFAWEFETTFDELDSLKCLPSDSNRDKLLGCLAMLSNPAFLWDAWVFKSTCQSLNGKVAAPDIMEDISPAKLAYAVDEINSIFSLYEGANDITPLYNDQPKIYIAGCCHSHGLINLPKNLSFCDRIFNSRFPTNSISDLKNEVSNPLEVRKHQEIDAYTTSLKQIRDSCMKRLLKPGDAL